RELLLISEFHTKVCEGEERDEWKAGELHWKAKPPCYTPRMEHIDLWWVDAGGMVLADGLRTDQSYHPQLVVNLRGACRPSLTVDRTRVLHWDRAAVQAAAEESCRALASWEHLTFAWIWNFALVHPALAETVIQELISRGRALPIGFVVGHLSPAWLTPA